MSKPLPLEYCMVCDMPTGNAGEFEDSIYCPDCAEGPMCDDCECWCKRDDDWAADDEEDEDV